MIFLKKKISKENYLLFGELHYGDILLQCRFIIEEKDEGTSAYFAPYGMTPVEVEDINITGDTLHIRWHYPETSYSCKLYRNRRAKHLEFTGKCIVGKKQEADMVLREFKDEDNRLEGKYMAPSLLDIAIINRAITLLNDGKAWRRNDDRFCNKDEYPYKWSLFCALHQASLEEGGTYLHLCPAIEAVRQAVTELYPGRNYEHTLQEFNNNARSFSDIARILDRGLEIIKEKLGER
jgi:hypothetical protein